MAGPDASRPPHRILVYEDDEGSGHAFAAVLRRAGYEVLVALHFEQALNALEADDTSPDLLLADIVAPGGVNGLAMARMARMKRPSIKVIYVTGYSLPNVEELAHSPLLRKPVVDELLLSEVRRLLATA